MDDEKEETQRKIIQIIISFSLFLIGILFPFQNLVFKYSFFIVSYLIAGLEVIVRAFRHLVRGVLIDENFLMTVATLGAIFIGCFSEAVFVMLFYQIGELFQDLAVDRSRKHVKELIDIRPEYARVKKGKKFHKVYAQEVVVGDVVLVEPGERVPLDGKVVSGKSFLDTVSITGESVPRVVCVGDMVYGGCINQNSNLEIEVTAVYQESLVSRILNLVEDSVQKKAHHERFITTFSKIYTPIVVGLAVILGFVVPFVLHDSMSLWVYRALSFLVVSCPCALVISIPLSFFAGIGVAAGNGILIKGGSYLEMMTKVRKIIFDKTGTLTEGVFHVQKIIAYGISEDELLKFAAYSEVYSHHPIAVSVREYYGKEIDASKVFDVCELSGLGIKADVFGKKVLVGNGKFMEQENISYEISNDVGTVLYVAIDGSFCGMILIGDEIKENAYHTIQNLKDVEHIDTVMLTGDRDVYAKKIYDELKLDSYVSSLLPDEKVSWMEKISSHHRDDELVAFVGDGMNDAPVLRNADIGIAMGDIGSDAALDAADIILVNDDLFKIITLLHISRSTLRIVKQNIVFSIFMKILILILSVLGLCSMWLAVFADVGVTFLTVLNSLRLFYKKY